ncbi:lipooligosaccharide transport system permease protein [Asanoa hainanensis]|uniref:Transport permease protein n=1 Tax=Asanoa hainanensis TaxID=560556 RepID=A0A239MB89_9ACTN|nr:ABC transporter permease [Asanoa hainanensis]SNT39079.1 lipooligosaccharide transport system permease protein [Asanoa hainanensis]
MTATLAVFEYHLVGYRRTWRGSVFGSFLLPLLTMLGFGVGVGAYIAGGVGGVSYLDYVVPGLLASTVVQVTMFETTWPVLGNFEWHKIYFGQAAAPLRAADILGGHLVFVLFRAVLCAAPFLLIATLFGAVHSWWALATLPVVALLAFAVAAPTIAYSATVRSDSYLALLFRFAVLPMSLFAGVFFPVESMPVGLRWVAYATPLWHGVDLCRAATLGVAPQWSGWGHVGYLALWAAAGWWLARRRFQTRLFH